MIPKAQETKAKINRWDYIKLKNFCKAINKRTRKPMEWEKIFANHISDKVLICKKYKELIKQQKNQNQKNTPIYIYIHTHIQIYHTHTYTRNNNNSVIKKEILPFGTTWMNVEYIMLSGINQTEKTNTL